MQALAMLLVFACCRGDDERINVQEFEVVDEEDAPLAAAAGVSDGLLAAGVGPRSPVFSFIRPCAAPEEASFFRDPDERRERPRCGDHALDSSRSGKF